MSSAAAARPEPFRLRGGNFNLLVLRLLDPRPEVIVPALADQFRRAPGFLRNAPIVLGLDDVDPTVAPDFAALATGLRSVHISPIGTTGGVPEVRAAAQAAGLPPLRAAGAETPVAAAPAPAAAPAAPEPPPPPPAPSGWQPTMVLDGSVRAGQRVWGQSCDVIVHGTVNAGAEVIADGNVHVYGALKGRAIAGGAENMAARIFALQFDPELVSIAGYYAVRDELGDAPIGKAVQATLTGERMKFDRLG